MPQTGSTRDRAVGGLLTLGMENSLVKKSYPVINHTLYFIQAFLQFLENICAKVLLKLQES